MAKRTSGDVIKINITPPSDSFPWIKLFRHPYGIKSAGREVDSLGAMKGHSRRAVALKIGEKVIENSRVLNAWFR